MKYNKHVRYFINIIGHEPKDVEDLFIMIEETIVEIKDIERINGTLVRTIICSINGAYFRLYWNSGIALFFKRMSKDYYIKREMEKSIKTFVRVVPETIKITHYRELEDHNIK